MRYAPLWVRSNASFLEGASHPEELVERAAALGLPALGLADRDGVYGMVRAHLAAREHGVRLLAGATVSAGEDGRIVLHACSETGWANLCRLLTLGRRRCPKGRSQVSWPEVAEHAAGLLALWPAQEAPEAVPGLLQEAFGDRMSILLTRHRQVTDPAAEAQQVALAARHGLPLVAAQEVLYHQRSRRRLQDVLTAIRHRTTVAEAGRCLRPNTEHELKSPHAFDRLFHDQPGAVARSLELAERCHFSLDEIRYRYPSEKLPDGLSSMDWLSRLTFDGARNRYGGPPPSAVREQLERELELIERLDYPGYFLTMHEIVRYCREHGILAQGRGSAANSAVCYCLGITAIDPVRMELLFERFLSLERAEPPDIDLDIEHDRREEVIQHVYATYGRDHAAMVANLVRYRPRSAVREVGKALGLPQTQLDRLARLVPYWGAPEAEHFRQAGFDPEEGTGALLAELSSEILDFPRHLSIHPGGFLLGQRPVWELVPIENASMDGRTVIQWDKEDIEALGLFKVDLLGLGALNVVHRTFDLLREQQGLDLSLASLPAEDPATYEMARQADTVGVFQIESRAQMAMLPRLKPKNFHDLVVQISIVRPGPISGNMVHPYLKRRDGREPVTYPHPSLEPVLARTLGIPLFQEQVMKLAMVAADYSPGEADQLRRDMAAWRRTGRMERHRERLIHRMTAKGIAAEFAERVFEQICGFGEYGFPESHGASFALIAYATAYLKCHHPAAYLCAILNAQPMGFYAPATLVDDARRHGVQVLPVDVGESDWECRLEGDRTSAQPGAVRLGLACVRQLGAADGERLLAARRRRPFRDLADFVRRCGLARDRLDAVIAAGACESLQEGRRRALWDGQRHLRERSLPLAVEPREETPHLSEPGRSETLFWDYETTGLSPRGHPLEEVRGELEASGLPTAEAVRELPGGHRVRYAGYVICRQRPGTARGVVFLTLEDETGFVNVVIWQDVWKRHAWTVKSSPLLGITGRVQSEEGVVHVVAEDFWVPRLSRPAAAVRSRDFH